MKKSPINIGRTVQLFVDNHMIEMTHFLTRTMHSPKRYGNNPLVRQDRPWEQTLYFRTNTFNVYWDEREKLFKLWYEDLVWDYEAFMGRKMTATDRSPTPKSFHETVQNRYLYAESEDGIVWRKPELDHFAVDGRKTNICLGGGPHGLVHAATFILDPLAKDDAKRFKSLYWHETGGMKDVTLRAAHSADGRKWTVYPNPVAIGERVGHVTGDVIILTVDAASGEYWLDTREMAMCERFINPKNPTTKGWGFPQYPDDPLRITRRRISSTVSDNILVWQGLREMLVPDDVEDNIDDEFYGMVRFRVGDEFLGFLVLHRRVANVQEIHLIHSRDGFHWHRVGKRQPFLGLGPTGAWDCFMTETCTPPVMLDNEWRIYYGGSNLHHDWWMFGEQEGLDVPEAHAGWNGGETALGLATLRPEGFVSLDAGPRDGILVTRPFVSDGDALIVNVACGPKGYFDAELADANDDVVPGYERSACVTFRGDAAVHRVAWKTRDRLPKEVLARGAKLRLYFNHASIYSLRIA